ncbi:type IV pilus assembly protein PilM [Cellulomonas pakistanensis]|uniref:Pilus assembly protein PilM n=1 Tax=Cellulomonas pakistanensis TaxID=992287 RepID=A0A919P7N4_9CELL|nr:type IV pilus assembly protein PilM [Cellulomonas pakistanensis]GIG35113.1 pilus assembly protein PilM [Cellulomonas pakistanensis]
MAKTRMIGLDIGTTQVRAAEVEIMSGRGGRPARPTLVRAGAVQLPFGAVRDGEVAEPSTVGTAIKQLWAQQKFGSKDVVIGVGNQRVIVRELDLPAMPLPELKASLPFQVHDLIPVAVEDAILDYLPTGSRAAEHGTVVSGLLVAATKDTVRANIAAVKSAGLNPVSVDLSAFALARALGGESTLGQTLALVDIGARVTTVVIVANGVPTMVRLLPTGGQDATDAVSRAMSVPAAEAEGIKREIGFGFSVPAELDEAARALGTATTSLVESIRNTFVYYAASHPGAAAQAVFLTGGACQLPGLGQYLSSASRLPVSVGQPLGTVDVARAAAATDVLDAQHTFAVSVGLAMGAAA